MKKRKCDQADRGSRGHQQRVADLPAKQRSQGDETDQDRQAAALVDGLAPTLRPLHDVRQWRERIRQAQQSPGT